MTSNRMVLLPEVWKSRADTVSKVFDLSPWSPSSPISFQPVTVTDITVTDGSVIISDVQVINNILLSLTITGGVFAESQVSFKVNGTQIGVKIRVRDGVDVIPPSAPAGQPIFIIPEGGESGQVLAKGSNADGDLVWAPNGDISSFTPGDIGGLAITARLSEFETEDAKQAARVNLGVHIVDGGTFY